MTRIFLTILLEYYAFEKKETLFFSWSSIAVFKLLRIKDRPSLLLLTDII